MQDNTMQPPCVYDSVKPTTLGRSARVGREVVRRVGSGIVVKEEVRGVWRGVELGEGWGKEVKRFVERVVGMKIRESWGMAGFGRVNYGEEGL